MPSDTKIRYLGDVAALHRTYATPVSAGINAPAGPEGRTGFGSSEDERSEAVRVRLLGGFKVSVGSRSIEGGAWRLRKAASLVKLLALAGGHSLHREQTMDLLWPDLGKKAASRARQVDPEAEITVYQ